MATLSHSESRRLYSWWWDSHNSPKNSKWLQENLTDMDAKVKAMIKLIEEDADSFARRAEMYYKKRPELMKLVEEFYRAYRALAERYDHATVELRQAQRTMAEAFPNQVPFVLSDDSTSSSSAPEAEPQTPEMPHPIRALFEPDDLHKDALGLSSSNIRAAKRDGVLAVESDSGISKKGLKQLNEIFGSGEVVPTLKHAEGRHSQNLQEVEEKERSLQDDFFQVSIENQNLQTEVCSESEHSGKAENVVRTLKENLADVKAEKEAILLQYQQSLDKLSNLDRELNRAKNEVKGLDDRASKAETEVHKLKETLVKLEAERDAGLLQYKQCLERISSLETVVSLTQNDARVLNERATKAEIDAQNLKLESSRLEAEKEVVFLQYKKCLEKISALENKILHAEEGARMLNECTDRAENEVKALKQALEKSNEEKESLAIQYKHCLETISKLEREILCAQEDAKQLNVELLIGTTKLKNAEEHCVKLKKSNHSLQLEVESLTQKMMMKDHELSKKQEKLEKLQICVQEEHSRFLQVESTVHALQNLHSQSQEEQRALALEVKNGLQMLKDLETSKHGLEEEIQQVKKENLDLNDLKLSSTILMKNLQDEISNLREMKEKLEEEAAQRGEKINALEKEIHHLKDEIKGSNRRYLALVEQVESVGLDPECIASSVKALLDENSKLKEIHKKDEGEMEALSKMLENMGILMEKNSVLESSLSAVNDQLECAREMVKSLQESCNVLQEEKSTIVVEKAALFSQLQIVTENMQKLLEKNSCLENALSGVNFELERSREKSRSLEESCQLLNSEKSNLHTEKCTLVSQLENVEQRLESLEKRFKVLEEKYSGLEKQKETTLLQVEELQVSLCAEKQERASFMLSSEARLVTLENHIHVLQEENRWRRKEFEEELDDAVNAQVEIFILQKFIQDMEEKNFSLFNQCQRHIEASKLSEKLISDLESENLEQQVELEFLLDEIGNLKTGIFLVLKAFQVDSGNECKDVKEQILKDEKQKPLVENSVMSALIGELRLQSTDLESEKRTLDQKFNQVSRALRIDPDNGCEDEIEQDKICIPHIVRNIEHMKGSLLELKDVKQQMVVENSVLLTLIRELGLQGTELLSERKTHDQEFNSMKEHLAVLQHEKHELQEASEKLRLEVSKGGQQEKVLIGEMEDLSKKLVDLQEDYIVLQKENSRVIEANRSLLKEFSDQNEEKCLLEEENCKILHEAISYSNLALICKCFGTEKAAELKALAEDLDCLYGINDDLKEEVGILGQKLESKEVENLHLKESVEKLDQELHVIRDLNDQLNHRVLVVNDCLCQKERELAEAEQELKVTRNLNAEQCGTVDVLQKECRESKIMRENLEKQILELSEHCSSYKQEIECLREVNGNLESEMGILNKEIEECKIREENLSSELQERSNNCELWEAEAASFYFDLQICSVHEVLFENKVHELTGACECLEDESASKSVEIEQMREKVSCLESEIGGLKAQLAAYVPVIDCLKDDIASLEHNTLLRTNLHGADRQEPKEGEMAVDLHQETHADHQDQSALIPDGISDLQKMHTRIKAVENAVVAEKEKLAMQENLKANVKLEAAKKEIEELKSKILSLEEKNFQNDGKTHGNELGCDLNLQKTEPRKSGILMKDIPLDQVSDSSLYGISRKENCKADDVMLELWETAEKECSPDPLVTDLRKQASASMEDDIVCHTFEDVEQNKNPSSKSHAEKELSVDKLEVSTSVVQPYPDGNKRKISERLASDAQKLQSLHTTVQDLKRKMEENKKSKKAKSIIEYETLKEQLQEAEETVVQLADMNGQLTKNIEEIPLFSDGTASAEFEEAEYLQRKRVEEQARKNSEKIGRLHLEVQKIQYVLLKLEDEKNKVKNRFSESRTSTLLGDFINSSGRNSERKKKSSLCGCTRPQTNGD